MYLKKGMLFKREHYQWKKNAILIFKKQHNLHKQESTDDGLLGKFIYQFQPETKTLRKLERILNKLYR